MKYQIYISKINKEKFKLNLFCFLFYDCDIFAWVVERLSFSFQPKKKRELKEN